jgi:hypothetical protein
MFRLLGGNKRKWGTTEEEVMIFNTLWMGTSFTKQFNNTNMTEATRLRMYLQ